MRALRQCRLVRSPPHDTIQGDKVAAGRILRGMHAERGTVVVTIGEGGAVTPITYELPVASAQVKSAVLLAGTER